MAKPTYDGEKLRKEAGAYIKQLRIERNLTQRELAQLVGLDYYTVVSQVEVGKASVPSHQLEGWASALGVDLRKFARKLLECYNPHTAAALFGDHPKSA